MFWAPQLQVWRINEWRPLSRVNRTVSPSAWQVSGTTASYTSLLPSLRQHWPAIKLLKLLCWRKSQHGGLWWSGSKAEHHPRLPAVLPSPALPPGQAVFLSLPLPGMLPGIGHASSLAPPVDLGKGCHAASSPESTTGPPAVATSRHVSMPMSAEEGQQRKRDDILISNPRSRSP